MRGEHQPQPDDRDLGLALAVLRVARGWTQGRLSQASGVRASSISDYEGGKTSPELDSLRRLLKAMDYGFAELELAEQFLSALRLRRSGAAEDAPAVGVGDPVADQVAELAHQVGGAVHRLTDAIAYLVRERGTAAPPAAAHAASGTPSAADRLQAPDLWERLNAYPFAVQVGLVRETPDFRCWALAEHLCLESETVASHQPARAIELARLACEIAERLPGSAHWRSAMTAFCWAHLGNARRVHGTLPAAEEAFHHAEIAWQEGHSSGLAAELLDLSRLFDLKASLRCAQRRRAEALELLDQAAQADAGQQRRAMLLLKKAHVLEETGDLERAIATLLEAEPWIGAEEPRLHLVLRHNLVDFLSKAQHFEEAAALLPQAREISQQSANEFDYLRLRWVEARILAGTGQTENAIGLFNRVRAAFARRGIAFDTALVSLELATIHARLGNTDAVKSLARHMAPIFQAQAVPREALAALALFRQAAEREMVSLGMAEQLVSYLRRAQYDPELKFEEIQNAA